MKCAAAVASLALLAGSATAQQARCNYLESAPTKTLDLPMGALVHPLQNLPIEFRGVTPVVTRRTIKHGEKARIVVEKYSSEPNMFYDYVEGKVVISNADCDGGGTSGGGDSGAATCGGYSWLPWAGASLLAGVTNGPTAAAGVAAAGLLQGVHGQEEACTPVVKLVVEAPSAYVGAVETCLEEIGDPEICPEPFPEYPVCDDPAPTCGVAVVGGGAGGLYTALRMVDEGKIDAADVCVFEMTERVGGRLMSLRGLGPDGDLTVDAGGYRTWPEFTPTAHALITEYLGVPMDCYDDSDPCSVYNIVDDQGKKAGFTLFVETMMQRLVDGGACWYPYHELDSFAKIPNPDSLIASPVTELYFSNGVTATATVTTILNLPQRPLLKVVRNSDLDTTGMLDMATMDALHSVQTVIATKLYLYYPKGSVFWHKLGLYSGDYEQSGDARRMLLAGRYHDGQVECDDPEDLDTCHGFLLAVYANDLSGNKAQYFRRFQREREEPVTILANTDLEGREFLRHAHQRLVEYHVATANATSGLPPFQVDGIMRSVSPPEFAILSNWNTAVPWAGGAWHTWTDLSNIALAKQPFVDDNVFVVNEAYSLLHGWAEGSLKVADEILEEHFDVPRPWSFPAIDLNQVVLQTSSEECVEASSSESSGGGGGNVSGGGGGAGDVLCFSGESLVRMADGTYKRLDEMQVGDLVATGTSRGAGRVTQVLQHPVPHGQTPLVVLETPFGPLVGTADHPVLLGDSSKDEWIDFGKFASDQGLEQVVAVDYLYNLEIDGDDIEGSSHSYVVNGVIASGLGDHEVLNKRFARQEQFKQQS